MSDQSESITKELYDESERITKELYVNNLKNLITHINESMPNLDEDLSNMKQINLLEILYNYYNINNINNITNILNIDDNLKNSDVIIKNL